MPNTSNPRNKQINVSVNQSQYKTLKDLSDNTGIPVSTLCFVAIKQTYLDKKRDKCVIQL